MFLVNWMHGAHSPTSIFLTPLTCCVAAGDWCYMCHDNSAFSGEAGILTVTPTTTCNVAGTAPYACVAARAADMGLQVKFTTAKELPVGYKAVFTVTGMVGTTKTKLFSAAGAYAATAATTKCITDDQGTSSTADDGAAKYTDNTDYERTEAATEAGGFKLFLDDNSAPPGAATPYAVLTGTSHAFDAKTNSFSLTVGPLTKALKQIKGGTLKLGMGLGTWTNRDTATANLKESIEGAVLDATGTLLSTSTVTVPI